MQTLLWGIAELHHFVTRRDVGYRKITSPHLSRVRDFGINPNAARTLLQVIPRLGFLDVFEYLVRPVTVAMCGGYGCAYCITGNPRAES